MSGIFGIFEKGGRAAAKSDLEAMRAKMESWGPDGHGLWSEGPVGLGHLLLDNLPQRGRDPRPVAAAWAPGYAITADARLDHREELIDALGLSRAEEEETPDDLLLLRAWIRWDEGCLERLHGAFAFAVWDGRRQRLTCVRDHQGFRPFFHWDGSDRFAFATEVEALFALEGIPRELDPLAVTAKLTATPSYLKERSVFRNIRKLAPATLLSVQAEGTKGRQYWFPEKIAARQMATSESLALELRELVERAVGTQLRSRVPIGAHVSGGLDSTSIALVARRLLLEQARDLKGAYSWSPPLEGTGSVAGDERRRVEAASRRLGLPIVHLAVSEQEFAEFASRDPLTEPTATLLLESAVCRRAAREGVRVLLSGWGGDEFASFNGRGAQLDFLREGRLIALARALGRPWRARAGWIRLTREVLSFLLPAWAVPLAWRSPRWAQDFPGGQSGLRAHLTEEEWRMLIREWNRHRIRGGVREYRIGLWARGHLSGRIEDWAREAAALGVEYRYPLLDRRVVEFSLSLPAAAYWGLGQGRGLFRAAAAPWLPAEILEWRRKDEPALRAARLRSRQRRGDADRVIRPRPKEVERIAALRRQAMAAVRGADAVGPPDGNTGPKPNARGVGE